MTDDDINNAALVAKVSRVLLSAECQRINFRWGKQHINAKAYRAVVLALFPVRAFTLDDTAETRPRRKLIGECGYHRRHPELAELDVVIRRPLLHLSAGPRLRWRLTALGPSARLRRQAVVQFIV